MSLSEAARITHGALHGSDRVFSGVSIDSRNIDQGDLFVAIKGDERDGHAYVSMALEQGAAGALVSHESTNANYEVCVNDTTIALGQLGADWRQQFDIPIAGITGSNGKTTVTAMVSSILNQSGRCLSPVGSFNNQWGVPLTLLKLRECHSHAAIEMGMNHVGEIDHLTRIARPNVVLINNAAAAHLEGLGSVDVVAQAKAEIINGLPEDGVVILNADDAFYDYWCEQAAAFQILPFSLTTDAPVTIRNLQLYVDSSQFDLQVGSQQQRVELPLAGKHNVSNALAAAAVCHGMKVSLMDITAGLEHSVGVRGRLAHSMLTDQITLIDDTYNANPASMQAAISVLAGHTGKTILVLGAMAELGTDAVLQHEQIGRSATHEKIDALFTLDHGDDALIQGYLEGFRGQKSAFSEVNSLVACLMLELDQPTTILIKGSRSSAMERVVTGLIEQFKDIPHSIQSESGELLC